MLEYVVSATLLGLAGGFGPGPLLTLVIAETMQHGVRSGINVAIAPLLTDAPIIAVSLLVLSRLSQTDWILGAISIGGGLVVLKMGIDDVRSRPTETVSHPAPARSLGRGAVVNALNPHPYIFWFSVGGPVTVRAAQDALVVAVVYVSVFYALLVGSKVLVAVAVGRSRAFLSGRLYLYTMRGLGIALCIFAILLFRYGWTAITAR